jgi:signal transduction histidine kinase
VAGAGEALLVSDVRADARYVWMQGSATLSEVIVPIIIKGRVVGVLDVQSDHLDAFDESDVSVLQSLASQAAIAIQNARLYEDTRNRLAQLTALQETTHALASTLEQDKLLKLIIQQATDLLDAQGGLINLVDWEKREDEVVAATTEAAELVGACSPLDSSLSGWVTLHNQPVVSNQVSTDSRVSRDALAWLTERNLENATVAPVVVKDRVVGTLAVFGARADKGGFHQADLDLLVAFASQAAVAIENARLYEQAQQLAVVEERGRLARDLHDAVTQTLFSASLIAEALPAIWASDQAEGQQLLQELRQLSRGALAEMRTLLLELRPAALMEADLADLLRQLAEAITGRAGIEVVARSNGKCRLPEDVHVALYRIAQEALNNVVKHAHASRAQIVLRREPASAPSDSEGGLRDGAKAELTISDDGRGFDLDTISPDHLGLGIIRERAGAIGAALSIESRPGTGTRVKVIWPGDSGEQP